MEDRFISFAGFVLDSHQISAVYDKISWFGDSHKVSLVCGGKSYSQEYKTKERANAALQGILSTWKTQLLKKEGA